MAQNDENKVFVNGGLDQDSAPEYVAPEDYVFAQNWRTTGTAGQQLGYGTNIESNVALSGALLPGINDIIGGGSFPDTGEIAGFRFNSAGNCQIILYTAATESYQVVYTDGTDSGVQTLLPLNPANTVLAILINKTYLVWWANGLEVGYTNLRTLTNGGYGPTVLWEDLSLLKPQCMPPPTGVFGNDPGKPANFWYGLLPQYSVQYVNADFNYSAWSTWSARIVPYQENTPVLGQNVGLNNYIIVSLYAGSIRASTVNIARRTGTNIFEIVKSVDRTHIIALPNTSVDVATEVYEAYDPETGIYSFVDYNNSIAIPVSTQESQLTYDYIWPSNAGEKVNGNIIGLGDFSTLYPRPTTAITAAAVGYNPNIAIPAGTYGNPLTAAGDFPGSSGSGAGNHRRNMWVILTGVPQAGDTVIIIQADIRNATNTINLTYQVPTAQAGNLLAVVQSISAILVGSYAAVTGGYQIFWTGQPYFGLQTFSVELYFAGASVANSVASVPDNTNLQLALSYRDYKARFFPLCTDNTYIVNMPSFAQQNGSATKISVQINTPQAPEGAVDYQLLTTVPPVLKILDTIATLLVYQGAWNARTNSPTLAINSGNIGDTYQITTPFNVAMQTATTAYTNLGTGEDYNTGDYITNIGGTSGGSGIGQYYKVLPKSFGNIANTAGSSGLLVFSLNALALLNANYAQSGVSTNLVYSFAQGDRCTLHYWIPDTGGVGTFTVTPGSGYTDGTYTGVSLSGGTGTGAVATVVVTGGVVTNVTITTPGTGYVSEDTNITGTVPAGSGWFLTITQLQVMYFNNPCIDLAVLGYDAATYLVKVENSSALTYAGGHVYYNGNQIDVRNIFIRLYSPAPQVQSASTTQNATTWYEVGQRYTITNGIHDVLNLALTDGGAYYKTRQFPDAILPYANPPVDVVATDLNYSDFYPSNFHSFGRLRTYNDELVQTERAASIITSQPYILGSQNNGLNRFYQSEIYGEADGQTSSAQGSIQILWQRGNVLLALQATGVFYIPVNIAYTQLSADQAQESISEKLLNNGRYASENVGIGNLKESFWTRFSRAGFVSPQYSEPFEIDVEAGIRPISGKMSKFFKLIINQAVQQGKKVFQFYNEFYEEVIMTIQGVGGVAVYLPFQADTWNPFSTFAIVPADVSATPNGSHSTASYNSSTGVVTYTPSANYVGGDTATFTFDPGTGPVTLNNCLTWIAGTTTVNPFVFAPQTGVALSTYIQSNAITVSGPNIAVPISISGGSGQYSINGGAFTSVAGTTVAGDLIVVEVMSSGSPMTGASTTLTIGATSGTFTATTGATGNFSIEAQYGITITNLVAGTATGIPTGTFPITPGNRENLAYTAVVAGTIIVSISGTPVFPNQQIDVYIGGGSAYSRTPITVSTNYTINLPNTSNPTTILIVIDQF